jgi:hypothetical protein
MKRHFFIAAAALSFFALADLLSGRTPVGIFTGLGAYFTLRALTSPAVVLFGKRQ